MSPFQSNPAFCAMTSGAMPALAQAACSCWRCSLLMNPSAVGAGAALGTGLLVGAGLWLSKSSHLLYHLVII